MGHTEHRHPEVTAAASIVVTDQIHHIITALEKLSLTGKGS